MEVKSGRKFRVYFAPQQDQLYHGRLGEVVAGESTFQQFNPDARQTDSDWRRFLKLIVKDETHTVCREREKEQRSLTLSLKYLLCILS